MLNHRHRLGDNLSQGLVILREPQAERLVHLDLQLSILVLFLGANRTAFPEWNEVDRSAATRRVVRESYRGPSWTPLGDYSA